MPAVARVGDQESDIPCGTTSAGTGSSNVFVNGIAVHRVGDMNNIHANDQNNCKGIHQASLASGSPNILVNGKAIGRVGDNYRGCSAIITQGSGNVFAN